MYTFESASVIYSSGSNIFGDADDDVQTFYGDMVVNGTDLFVDASTSRVGITTSTPAHTLDVDSGDIRVSQSGKYLLNNSNVGMYRDANDLMLGGYGAIRFLSSATAMPSQTERMIIDGFTGNVGIGTTSPTEKLTVEGNISGSGNLNIAGGVTGSSFTGSFVGDGSALTGITAEWDGSHNGDAEITGSLVVSGSSAELTVKGRVQVNEGTVNRSIQLRNDGLYISRTADGAYLSRVVGTSNGNQIDVAGQSAVNLKIATNIALRIDTNRNIGIGTSAAAPGGRLHVKGAGTTSATNALLVENSSGTVY